jgi:hypothetical protein
MMGLGGTVTDRDTEIRGLLEGMRMDDGIVEGSRHGKEGREKSMDE